MFFFPKKILQENQNTTSAEDSGFKILTENLYKQNLELAIKNKIFSLLRQLYQVSLQVLEPKELTQKIVTLVRDTLNFELVSIYLFDDTQDTLTPYSVAQSERFADTVDHIGNPFALAPITNVHAQPYFAALYKITAAHTEDIFEVWGNSISTGVLHIVRNEAHVKSAITYPLQANGAVVGALVIGFNRRFEELTEFERDSLDTIVTVTAVALDRARLYAELTEANKQQIVLIHFITHQIKGFVSKSRTIFSMIKEGEFGAIPQTMHAIVDEGFDSDTKGIATIQEILNASNIKSGKVTYAKQTYDLSGVIREVIQGLQQNARTKGLELTATYPQEKTDLMGDQMQMTNAIKNVIDNSIKYTPTGTVHASLTHGGEKLVLTVEDTGVGISPEDMKRLFTEGGHGKDSHLVNVESTGFGLYIVKNIVEAQGGTVRAESDGVGTGSRFIIELPLSSVV
jgi:signal transduction histidine kinase